ncbi:MAG: hypothetical protein FJW22_14920 [Acidimicrobiia bacterium]|nr:hypothetical protein [Acidimicrobiia bacterium]
MLLALVQPTTEGKTAGGIACDVRGTGPAVVLLTGSNLDRRIWEREAHWFAKSHTVIRYDLPAHGKSDTVTAPTVHRRAEGGLQDRRPEAVKVPTLILVGDKDEFQREHADALARRVPGARLVTIAGGGR